MVMALHAKQQNNCRFYVVHPLDDQAEVKCSADNLGPMKMTPSVKYSLLALQGYLVLMGALVSYRVLALAGLLVK
jgi:hypothetical protein